MKRPLKRIVVTRAEGTRFGPYPMDRPFPCASWDDANSLLRRICLDIDKKRLGYDKVDVLIEWVGGDTYTLRYDAAHPDSTSFESPDVARHLLGTARFYYGLKRPDHIPEERYWKLVEEYAPYVKGLDELIAQNEIPGGEEFTAELERFKCSSTS